MSRTHIPAFTSGSAGQHLALSVAALLARSQLVTGEAGAETTDLVARALAKVAPLYVRDSSLAEPRPLAQAELEGATVRAGGTVLALADGRTFSSVTIKRADLRPAIGILKAIGIGGLEAQHPGSAKGAGVPAPNLAARVGEIEDLLEPPLMAAQLARANHVLVSLARDARRGAVANFAMQLMSALHGLHDGEAPPPAALVALARLRAAVEELERA